MLNTTLKCMYNFLDTLFTERYMRHISAYAVHYVHPSHLNLKGILLKSDNYAVHMRRISAYAVHMQRITCIRSI